MVTGHSLAIRLGCMLVVAVILSCLPFATIKAASGIKIYDYSTKKTTTYTDKQIKVTLNGQKISSNSAPGILVNQIALVPYTELFEKSAIAAVCTYDDKKGTITIAKDGITIAMTLNSKKATVNKKAVTLPVAPKKIRYNNSKTAKVLVPSRFVSETLGLGYTWNSSTSTVAIVKNSILLSYNNGTKFEYKGVKGQVTLDGGKINLGDMPSIITNNTAMLRAKRVFSDSDINASYEYISSKKQITLTKDDNELIMTVGSTAAYLNSIPIKLDTAPMIVKNFENKTSYVMVPGSVTAISLGYQYAWNKEKSTSEITTKSMSADPEQEQPDTTQPGTTQPDTTQPGTTQPGTSQPDTIIQQYQAPGDTLSAGGGIQQLQPGVVSSGFINMLSRDYSNTKKNAETFAVYSSAPFGTVTSSNNGNTISILAPGMLCTDQTYQMYGNSSNYINTIRTQNDSNMTGTVITVDAKSADYTYDISLSDNKQILYVNVYRNSITAMTIGTNSNADTITLTGLSPLNVTISPQANYLFIDLPYIVNGIGDQSSGIISGRFMNQCYINSLADKTQIILEMKAGYKAVVSSNAAVSTITIQSDQVTQPDQSGGAANPGKYEIVIPKPADLSKSQITDLDDYFNNRFVIKLPGDYTSFYNNNKVTSTSSVVKSTSVAYHNGETQITISTTKLQGYTYTTDSQNIYIHIGNPREIYKNIVVLDPGHGGPAPGANYFGTKEKDINLKILYEIGKKYFYSDPSKLKVYYTRTTDVDMSIYDRADFAAKVGADLFVSLHMNASTSSSPYGTEVYYYNDNTAKLSGMNSNKFANIMLNNLCQTLGSLNRGARSEKYVVVYKNSVPAILIELGFLSNKNDHAKITDPVYQEKAVKEIYDSLLKVFETYPTGR